MPLRFRGGSEKGRVNLREYKTGWSWRVEMVWGFVVFARLACVSTFHQPVLFRHLVTLLARVLDSVWPFYLSAITLHHFLHTTKFGQVPVAHCRFISKVVWQCSKGPPPRQQIHSYRIYQWAPISVLSHVLRTVFVLMTQHNIQQEADLSTSVHFNHLRNSHKFQHEHCLQEPLCQHHSAN